MSVRLFLAPQRLVSVGAEEDRSRTPDTDRKSIDELKQLYADMTEGGSTFPINDPLHKENKYKSVANLFEAFEQTHFEYITAQELDAFVSNREVITTQLRTNLTLRVDGGKQTPTKIFFAFLITTDSNAAALVIRLDTFGEPGKYNAMYFHANGTTAREYENTKYGLAVEKFVDTVVCIFWDANKNSTLLPPPGDRVVHENNKSRTVAEKDLGVWAIYFVLYSYFLGKLDVFDNMLSVEEADKKWDVKTISKHLREQLFEKQPMVIDLTEEGEEGEEGEEEEEEEEEKEEEEEEEKPGDVEMTTTVEGAPDPPVGATGSSKRGASDMDNFTNIEGLKTYINKNNERSANVTVRKGILDQYRERETEKNDPIEIILRRIDSTGLYAERFKTTRVLALVKVKKEEKLYVFGWDDIQEYMATTERETERGAVKRRVSMALQFAELLKL